MPCIILAALSISMLCSCAGAARGKAYQHAFDPADRKVLVVVAAPDRLAVVNGASNAGEGLAYGALQSLGAAASIVYIPFIPVLLYKNAEAGAKMAAVTRADPDWQSKLADWLAKERIEEVFRADLQSHFPVEDDAFPRRFASIDAALTYVREKRTAALTVVAITKVTLPMETSGCGTCVAFRVWANFDVIDGQSGVVLLHDFYASGPSDAAPLPDYLAHDCAKLDTLIPALVDKLAASAAENFRVYR